MSGTAPNPNVLALRKDNSRALKYALKLMKYGPQSELPILADMLEEYGFTNTYILKHLRSELSSHKHYPEEARTFCTKLRDFLQATDLVTITGELKDV